MIPDNIWDVMKDTLLKYKGIIGTEEHRKLIEEYAIIDCDNGVCFVTHGNEFDLFVIPERRGKWNIRGKIKDHLRRMLEKYSTVKVRIHKDNTTSLRLAKGFGFAVTGQNNDVVTLEVSRWVK